MFDEKFPDDVMKLRPRKLRLGQNVERLLEGVSSQDQKRNQAEQNNNLRPNVDSINAVRCESCGELEYITRDFCRCGHYLNGQIEDEYLAWERGLAETHERLATEAEHRMKPIRWASLSALPFIAWPLLHSLFVVEAGSILMWLWVLPGFAIYGLLALIETFLTTGRNLSARALETASFEQFLIERWSKS